MLEDGGAPRPTAESKEKQNDFAVTFRQVGLTYQNASDESLTNIDFTVRRGETVGIIGDIHGKILPLGMEPQTPL